MSNGSHNPYHIHRRRPRAATAAAIEPLERRLCLAAAPANVLLTSDPDVQQMPSVAVDPSDADHVVIAYMDRSKVATGYAGIGTATSWDDGEHWQLGTIPLPNGFDQGAANPLVRFDAHGDVFVTFMSVTYLATKPGITNPVGAIRTAGFQSNNGVFVVHSGDGGASWDQPVAVASHSYHGTPVLFDMMPDLAIDTFATLTDGTPNPNFGTMYVTWTRFYPEHQFPGEPGSTGGTQAMLSVSEDGGRTWQVRLGAFDDKPGVPTSVIRDGTHNTGTGPPAGFGAVNWPHVAIGPEGDVYVAFYDFGFEDVVRSTDAGRSFHIPDLDKGTHVLFDPAGGSNANLGLGLSNPGVRTKPVRAIVADPTRPNHVYAMEPIEVVDSAGGTTDWGEVMFARSADGSATWNPRYKLDPPLILNDDNGHLLPTGGAGDVTSNQAMGGMAINPDGQIVVVWLDTRRDPDGHDLDVFGTVSGDGGRHFAPNFRVTDTSFDADAGKFTNAAGEEEFFLGDFLGVAAAADRAYVVWTDTRNGNQDVAFARISLGDMPAAPDDRFAPNHDAGVATELGRVVRRNLPRLAVTPGRDDYFHVTATASGPMVVSALGRGADGLLVELLDPADGQVLATSQATRGRGGRVTGQRAQVEAQSGQEFLVRASAASGASAGYALDVKSLTGRLGTVVYAEQSGQVAPWAENYYLATAAADGSLDVSLTGRKGLVGRPVLDLLDPETLSVLAVGQAGAGGELGVAQLPVKRGQDVLVRVRADASTAGRFRLTLTNLDQYAVAAPSTLSLPAGAGPSQVKAGDLNGDGRPDLVVTDALSDVVSVLLGNGDGTFQAPRQFEVGAFVAGNATKLYPLNRFRRDVVIADFDNDRVPDLSVANNDSGDVSILLGRGDGTVEPQRRFDATSSPFALDAADVNGDGNLDLAAIESTSARIKVAVLLGRGDGTFARERLIDTPARNTVGVADLRLVDVNGDRRPDLLITGGTDELTHVLLGDGAGRFTASTSFKGAGPDLATADLDGDGVADVVHTNLYNNNVTYELGRGDGEFAQLGEDERQKIFAGQAPVAVVVTDVGRQVITADGDVTLGAPDGVLDLVVAASGFSLTAFPIGPGGIFVLPGLAADGKFAGFGEQLKLADAVAPQSLAVADFDGDGSVDVAYVGDDGLHVVYGKPPAIDANGTPDAARNLGTVVHLLQPTLTLTPGRADAYYTFDAPREAARAAGDQVIDVAGHFEHASGAGLRLELRGADGRLIGSGERFRVVVAQGERLQLRVTGVADAGGAVGAVGAGAYTLDVVALPQLVSVEAQHLIPGAGRAADAGRGATSLALTFQGERLDQAAAEDAGNYGVVWLGGNGVAGGGDDRVIAVAGGTGAGGVRGAIYDPGASVDVRTGVRYPTAVRQTVTLVFERPLPAGNYLILVSDAVGAAAFNQDEEGIVRDGAHSVVRVAGGEGDVVAGAASRVPQLVRESGRVADLGAFEAGTPLLSQLHGDLGALLDQQLSAGTENPNDSAATTRAAVALTETLLRQIRSRLEPGLATGLTSPTAFLALFLDPVSFNVVDPQDARLSYSLQTGELRNGIPNTFVSVAGNVELVVIPVTSDGRYVLDVADIPEGARGGAVVIGSLEDGQVPYTVQLRDAASGPGTRFQIDVRLRTDSGDVVTLPPVLGRMIAAAVGAATGDALLVGQRVTLRPLGVEPRGHRTRGRLSAR